MSEFKKLDQFMRTHVPTAAPGRLPRHRRLKSFALGGMITAALCLGLYQFQRREATDQEVYAAIEVLDLDLTQDESYGEISELVALVD